MPSFRVTQKATEKLQAPSRSGRQELFWDLDLKGFGVLTSGTTNAKTFVVQAAVGGVTRRVTIGRTNVLDAATARAKAREVLARMALGTDPKADRGAPTLAEALREYLDVRRDLSPNTRQSYSNLINKHLADWLNKPLNVITEEMVQERHRELGEDKAAGEATANGAFRAFRAIWNFIGEKKLGPHPVRLKGRWHEVAARTRLVTSDELPAFYRAVCALENSIHRDYILMLLFTGLRRREASALRWEHVDFKARTLRIPKENTKGRKKLDLPLTNIMLNLLDARQKLGNDGGWVFPSTSRSGHLEEPRFALDQVAAMSGVDVSPHDLRRSYLTAAESCDISVMSLMALVNHSLGKSVTSGYIQMTPERLREPAQKVANKIIEWCEIEDVGGNVARIR